MQDDKLDIQKILRDVPDESVESTNEAEEVEDDSQEVVEPVNADQETDDSDAVEPVKSLEDVMADESAEGVEEVVEPVNVDQETDDSDAVELAEEIEEAQEVAEEEPQEEVAPEVLDKAVKNEPQSEPKTPAEPLTAEEKKQRIMKVVVPLLLVGFVFMAKKSFFPSPAESVAQKIQPAEVVELNTTLQWQLPEEYPSSLRDPMRFGSVSSQQYDLTSESLVLKGIIFSSTPAAIVSGKIVKTGDEIMGATIVEIKRGSVVFRSGDRQWEQKVKR